jgi:hypothetical protein
VFSPYGGKLLYWFDLEDGAELVGNENFMRNYGEAYTNDNAYVPVAEGCDGYSWLCGNNIYPEIHEWNYEARRRCFNDSVWVEGAAQSDLVNRLLTYTLQEAAVEFQYDLGNLAVAKRFVPSEHSLSVEYIFSSGSSQALTADLLVENGLSPDCLDVMLTGRRALTYWDGEDTSSVFVAGTRGVANAVSGRGLLLDFETAPSLVSGEEDVFGLEVNPLWQLEIPAQGSGSVSLRLGMQSVSGVKPGDDKTLHGLLLIRPNPSRGSVDLYPRSAVAAPVTAEVYDARGRHVRTVSGQAGVGGRAGANGATGAVFWDGLDEGGRPVASGVYTVKVISGGATSTGKVTIVR